MKIQIIEGQVTEIMLKEGENSERPEVLEEEPQEHWRDRRFI